MRRAARVVGRALRTPVTGPARGIRKVTHAQGAGESGLGRLIELHGVNGAGDVMITVALASTVFFSVPTDEARGRVALYLAVTMLPFTLLAPVVGPLLDRLPHGRRAAMAGSMLARAVLALVLSGAVATGSLEMYPAALGVLVASKAYGVVRSAVVPRLLPQGFSLVKANSRVTLGGLLATGVAAPVGAGLQMIGPGWPLYGACLLFLGGAFLSFRLPPKVDSARGERRALLAADEQHLAAAVDARWDPVTTDDRTDDKTDSTDNKEEERDRERDRDGDGDGDGDGERGKGKEKERRRKGPGLRTVGPAVTHALAANACVRCQSGFLIFFLAFLLREHPLTGQSAAVSLAVVGVAAGAGNALGTAVGAWLRARAPEVIIVTVVGALVAVAVSAAVFFGAAVVAVLGAVAGFTQALAKLSLDALIQRDVPELVRTSAFARSETLLQMAWVVGGAIGIALPLRGPLGLSVGALIVALGWLTTVRALLASARRGASHPRVA
ncbi:MFS transporter [Streptomyces albidoflavus]|uniref:MFS transporter n=1 Tax=Streptomyces albidoflavus TaxID=1886 RepID=UPI0021D5D381|nr:MFS transporter [Streptomyces albidoflavus]MCU7704666.1 MFS transporter [Streptomyces albidoflavus]